MKGKSDLPENIFSKSFFDEMHLFVNKYIIVFNILWAVGIILNLAVATNLFSEFDQPLFDETSITSTYIILIMNLFCKFYKKNNNVI